MYEYSMHITSHIIHYNTYDSGTIAKDCANTR